MNLKKTILGLTIGLSIVFTSCDTKNESESLKKAKFVKVERVEESYGVNSLMFNGKVKEKSLTTVSFRVGGPLVKLNVKPGDFVEKGQVIAQIDKRDYTLQLQTNKAQYEQVEGEYNRYKELYSKDKIPANSYEKVESGYLMAKSGFENARNQLNDTELKAPVSGYIFEKFTENYQTVGPGMPIVSIIDMSELEVVISVSENQLAAVKSNTQSYVAVKNANMKRMPVSLLSISEKTKSDGMYEVKFIFKNNSDLQVSPGMTAEIFMDFTSEKKALDIPSSAVFNDGEQTCVWIYSEQSKKVEKRSIKVNAFGSGGRIEVVSGIKIGDTIVVAGVNSITEGQNVQLIKNPSKTNIGGLL